MVIISKISEILLSLGLKSTEENFTTPLFFSYN